MKKKIIRKIPATMVSQHPDHANPPYWQDDAFITTRAEIQECFLSFSDLGVSEYKWDWEGKLVDESVIERLLSQHYDFFEHRPIGVEKFLTFRLPNPRVETEFRIGRAFMGMLSAAAMVKQFNLPIAPLFEAILPMTVSAEEMIDVQEAFVEMANLKHPLYKFNKDILHHLELIPLFEDVETIMKSDEIVEKYLQMHQRRWGYSPSYMRPYVARSDPALNSGLVPTVLAIKVALSKYAQLEKKLKIPLYPIIGSASLPFRGGLRPDTVEQFTNEYKGVRTALLQSAFRYDFDQNQVKKAIQEIEHILPQQKAINIPAKDVRHIEKVVSIFEEFYKPSIEMLAPQINFIAGRLPKRRERVQHTGLFGYSRGTEKVKLPRAIGLTGALYSMGVPPEVIGTGRGLREAKKKGLLPLIEKYYLNLRSDLTKASRFVHREYIQEQAKHLPAWADLLEDIVGIEEYLGEKVGPITEEEKEHKQVVSAVVKQLETDDIDPQLLGQGAVLRKSMG